MVPRGFGFFAIGPTTEAALRDAGMAVLGVAPSPTTEDTLAAVLAWDRTALLDAHHNPGANES
jgi:hypothetical protein